MNQNPMLTFETTQGPTTGRPGRHRAAGLTNAVYDLACVLG